jgi:signal peptidase II
MGDAMQTRLPFTKPLPFLTIAVATVALASDQLVKQWIITHRSLGESLPLLPGVVQLTYVQNPGAAFSLLAKHPHWLLGISVTLLVGFVWFSIKNENARPLHRTALGLIVGGAVGNLLDRLLYGQVIDYIDVIVVHYPIFNLADSFICVGVVIMLAIYWADGQQTQTA